MKVVSYKDLERFGELDRNMIRPNVGEVVLEVVDMLSWGIMGTVVLDTEYCGICFMRVGLYEGVWHKEPVGRIGY